ncbi:MAG TPA: hypothetical protein VF148_03960 [Acidimicrobiia bacterium]
MLARKIRRKKRTANRQFFLTPPLDITYRDLVADLDPGMLDWEAKVSTTDIKAA